MRRNFFLLTIASALLTLSSCKKVWDYVKDHPNGTADNCKIDKITFTGVYYNTFRPKTFDDTLNFIYDNRGNLTKLNFASTMQRLFIDAYSFDSYFKYDANNRLTVYLEHYSTDDGNGSVGALRWHKYEYISSRIIIDTTYTYAGGVWEGTTPRIDGSGSIPSITRIELDDFGRVIRETSRLGDTNELIGEVNYSYDQSGNLIRPGITYTNKSSLLQTNKTLMFVRRDYSLNMQTGVATQFNSNNLPVKFDSGKLPMIENDGIYIYGENGTSAYQVDQKIKVDYNCKKN